LKDVKVLLLAAGLGTRLHPYTDAWPKCLMPIKGRPLLEYWLSLLHSSGIKDVLVNLHSHAGIVRDFLKLPVFQNWVKAVYEPELLGTAGSLRANADFFSNETILLIHADNLCCCDFQNFLNFHHILRPLETVMTMMTFECERPESCGIVELNELGVVQAFHEKVQNPPGNLANAAVYILEPEVFDWILEHPEVSDFSIEVLPHFIGKIATWKNDGVLRDIGTPEMLKAAQADKCESPIWEKDGWFNKFVNNQVYKKILHSL
jgi:mannose-1-phosphate guanylyltransferase